MSDGDDSEGCEDFYFLAYSSCYYFNLIGFLISIETEASLLALLNLYITIIIIHFYN